MIKKTLAAVSIVTALAASPVSAASKDANLSAYDAQKVAEDGLQSFPWVAVGIIGAALGAATIAALSCCD
jgi:hypothetical protein